MPNPFSHFWFFVGAVGVHVVTLAAGCIVTVAINLLEKYVFKRSLPWQADIGILLAFVFFACFQAWRDQYEIATKINQPPPVQITNQVNVPSTPAPVINFPPQMAYMASTDIGLVIPKLGDPIGVSNTCKNMSQSIPAEHAVCWKHVDVVDTIPNAFKQPIVAVTVQDKMFAQFEKSLVSNDYSPQTYGPGEFKFGTAFTDPMDQKMDSEFTAGTKTILFEGEYDWRDGVGKHINQVCAWLQMVRGVELGKAPITWNYCSHHNGLKSH